MRITSKGQVTIPKAIREKLGVKPGDEVEFVEVDGQISVRPIGKVDAAAERLAAFERYLDGLKEMRAKGLLAEEDWWKDIRDQDIPLPNETVAAE
jgi:AbrB family looped-hinge helix DNA binding protein